MCVCVCVCSPQTMCLDILKIWSLFHFQVGGSLWTQFESRSWTCVLAPHGMPMFFHVVAPGSDMFNLQALPYALPVCCTVCSWKVGSSDRDRPFSHPEMTTPLLPEVQSLLSKREKKRPSRAEETRQTRHTEGRSLAGNPGGHDAPNPPLGFGFGTKKGSHITALSWEMQGFDWPIRKIWAH